MAGLMSTQAPLSDTGTTLIARAEALNAFMKMQPAANEARSATPARRPAPSPKSSDSQGSGCLCFPSSSARAAPARPEASAPRPNREYYPDNLSVQPNRHAWTPRMEWLILACVDFLEENGLDERNLFAVSAVDDLVRAMTVPLGTPLPPRTDPHVAAGVIKAQIRHATDPLIAKECLRAYIDAQAVATGTSSGHADASSSLPPPGTTASAATYAESRLAQTVAETEAQSGAKRAYILARIMRLLGRVSANVEVSKMNAHCLAKCVAPSMLHWDPNSGFALLMLGKITAFVMTMIEDARVFDEKLCQKVDELHRKSQ